MLHAAWDTFAKRNVSPYYEIMGIMSFATTFSCLFIPFFSAHCLKSPTLFYGCSFLVYLKQVIYRRSFKMLCFGRFDFCAGVIEKRERNSQPYCEFLKALKLTCFYSPLPRSSSSQCSNSLRGRGRRSSKL